MFSKLNSEIPYAEELTVFIKVNTANLNACSNCILFNDKNIVNTKSDIIKIKTVKKYLFMSFVSKLILEKTSLFINTFLGLLNDRIWLIEYFVKEYIFKNFIPELVEKKEPPKITNIKYTKLKLFWSIFKEIPILEMLLTNENKL